MSPTFHTQNGCLIACPSSQKKKTTIDLYDVIWSAMSSKPRAVKSTGKILALGTMRAQQKGFANSELY